MISGAGWNVIAGNGILNLTNQSGGTGDSQVYVTVGGLISPV